MKTIDSHGNFEETLTGSSEQAQAIARQLRSLIIDLYPEVYEVPWPKQGVTGYGIGPKKMTEHFVYIGAFKEHVNLGFYHGADLDDPEGLLEGSGKKLRHVKVKTKEQLQEAGLKDLIQMAIDERLEALAR